MPTPLYNTDIIPLTSRPTLTVMDDGDYFAILDTSTGKISKILRTDVQKALSISYDNATSGLTATQVQAALDELVVNLGSSDSAISALGGRLDILEGADTVAGSVAKTVKDAVADLAGTGRTTETVKGNADAIALRELSANKVVAFQETPDDTHYPSEKLVDDSLKAIKGVDYTDGTLKSHEDRLDTLEADDTTEGSVAKTVKDAVEPIIDDVSDHETRIDSVELAIVQQGQDLASVKQTLQQGNGATLDFTGIGSVALDARATGRANPTIKGLTATNIVDGAGIANLGTVTFTSVLNHKYFDVLHGTILTGTGSDMTVTNDTGATADIAVIDLTSTFGAGNEPTTPDCAKIFSYFDGTKSIQLPARVRSVSEDESETSTLYIADNEELRSVPAISDEVKVVNGQLVKVQNVQRYVLQESDIVNIDVTGLNVDRLNIKKNTLSSGYKNVTTFWSSISGYNEAVFYGADDSTKIGMFNCVMSNVYYALFVAKGTYASLAEAQADLAGTVIYYQLATPITTPLLTSGILQAKPNGTVYYEPYYEGSHQTDASSQIMLPYEGTIDKLTGYDENLEPYEVPSTGYTLVGTLLTITGAEENEVYYVELSRSEPLAPEMSVNVINNDQVTLDSADGKYYQIGFTTTNGVPTVTATEVV